VFPDLRGGAGALPAQPPGEAVGVAADGFVEGRELIPADPVQVRAVLEQLLGDVLLVAVAGAPEGGGHRICIRCRGQIGLHSVVQAEGGGFGEGGAGAAFDQPQGRVPLPERDRVGHGGASADDGSVGFDVSARVEQRVHGHHVIAAGRPLQRRLGVRAGEPGIDPGARGHQRGDDGGTVREVTGPLRDHVQQGARSARITSEPDAG
jgi:hypothetical protein